MKIIYNTVLLALWAVPTALFASSDREVENAIEASYNYRAVLEDRVKVKVHEGVVTLTGFVEDQDEKNLAENTLDNFPGVTKVDNELKIKSSYEEHSDAWMAFKVRSLLLVKANVSIANTDVDVKDGVVTLSGSADNQAQKDLTGLYAKEIKWVKSVQNDIVVMENPKEGEKHTARENRKEGETFGDKIDDASITAQVKFALLSHKSTSALKTSVSTQDGVVTISGVADTDAEKSLAGKLAIDARGVKSVTNDMTVKS